MRLLIGVQYLRGIAAMLVIVGHSNAMAAFDKYLGRNLITFTTFYNDLGQLGVTLFFVLSGFIMVYISLAPVTLSPTIGVKKFMVNRFVRIIPFMWLIIILTALFRYLALGDLPLLTYLKSLMLYPIGDLLPNQIWTLRHEFLFYSLFCLSAIKLKNHWLLYLWFISPIIWINSGWRDVYLATEWGPWIDFLCSKHNLFFGLGYFLGIYHKKKAVKEFNPHSYDYLLCLFLVVVFLVVGNNINRYFYQIQYLGTIHNLYTGLLCVFLTYFMLKMNDSPHPNIINRIGRALGDASYSTYLTHGMLISALLSFYQKAYYQGNAFIIGFSILIISVLLGFLTYKWLEMPTVEWSKRLFGKS